MWNKTHTQSNEETEDGEEEDRESNVRGLLEQTVPIVDVWTHNFDAELQSLAHLAKYYPVIAFVNHTNTQDTEFPGSVLSRASLSTFYAQEELDYQHTWHNVERTKLIQVGFTLADPAGALPARTATWQFHLEFDLSRESLVPESIQLLREAGIDFDKLRTQGIPHRRFAESLFASGTPHPIQDSSSIRTSSGWCSTGASTSATSSANSGENHCRERLRSSTNR
jgi:hypothetical protein